ncbi:hypothetical protein [Rhodopirellula bahusiensis]|uniref:Uncharacterized protein n=1 Tax=Rhodopirellula bahusiensis TaxID=2014065 RepID=A0A2G1W9D4_9BACT|nr:hypothetical protein [Rhodopirellula bahusiensis]PHQ35633.1 hypothetical protein CEE69_08385 [Rhodopirellula bahusiensis]
MDHRFARDTVVQAAIHVHFNPLGTEVTEVAMQSNTNRWVGHFALRTVGPVENQEPVARRWRTAFVAGVAALASVCGGDANAQRPVVPGTGTELVGVADDFEDESWRYVPNNPKSTEDIDENQRSPMGKSTNGRWYEGIKRGHPDVVERVSTPAGGLPGSKGALLMRSKFTGIPGNASGTMHQDDFIANVQYRLKRRIDVSEVPSVTTRVFLPPVAEWEKRSGPHFGFRLALETTAMIEQETGFFKLKRKEMGNEIYWPGLFIEFESKADSRSRSDDYAYLRVRSNQRGSDFRGPQITTTGWWTLGMSVTPDGMVHYYASPGVEDLTEEDYITSQFPYGYEAERMRTFFYNVCSADDGRRWSTSFVVDDPKVFLVRPKGKQMARRSSSSRR